MCDGRRRRLYHTLDDLFNYLSLAIHKVAVGSVDGMNQEGASDDR